VVYDAEGIAVNVDSAPASFAVLLHSSDQGLRGAQHTPPLFSFKWAIFVARWGFSVNENGSS